ncbi:MAG TPA: PEP-CTERM sorting domain-containing protein, partial [Phycisphaerae bacterium]|nr:PEP-CTERM sorting domain-containing protein [Phycisphaerae bacterium]
AVDAVETLDLANIVVPFGETVTLLFFMNGTGGGEVIDTSFTVPIPEPATMGLLVLGGLAMLRRRNSRL